MWKLDDVSHTLSKCRINVTRIVGGDDYHTAKRFQLLQQVIDFDVRVAIVAILYFGSFTKQGVRFVEEKDCAAGLGGVEDALKILCGLANILTHNFAQIHPI